MYFSESNPFRLAVSSKVIIIALDCAPSKLWENNQFFLPITNDFIARSAKLLETAKRNGLDSEKYINYLLTNLPNEDTLEKNEILEAYLPWNKNIQETCR